MLYRKVPKTGEKISILGFGCMRLPLKDNKIDEERATRQIRSAIDRGVNYLDTAWPYHGGESESFVGRTLGEGYRDKVNLATKLPLYLIHTRADMDHYLNTQLKKLQTDRIDYYLLHSLNGHHWDNLNQLNILEFLDRAKADGRIRNAGFSFHGRLDDFKTVVDAYPWEFCQIQYNYLDEELQAGTQGLQYAAHKQLAVIVMEPLRGGKLGLPVAPPQIATLWESIIQKRTPVEWALRWVWNRPEVTALLSGMNEEAHIEENLTIAAKAEPDTLTPEELSLVDKVARTYRRIMKAGCTGCGYCMPCPSKWTSPIASMSSIPFICMTTRESPNISTPYAWAA
jgi:predicted aldo/keto reductase-like oxidoreductase